MFIAIGFPKSAREDGAEVLYVGLDKGKMLAACEAGAKTDKFQQIGKLMRPVFQKHCLVPAQYVKVETAVTAAPVAEAPVQAPHSTIPPVKPDPKKKNK